MLKGKSYMRTDTKSILGHALVLELRVMNSSFLLLYFFNFLLSFSLSSSFFSFSSLFHISPFFSFFVLYTMIFTPFPPSTCGSGVGSPFSLLPLPLLEPSNLSCKAACSLFRHHLHINAARELVGQHLMRGQQYL